MRRCRGVNFAAARATGSIIPHAETTSARHPHFAARLHGVRLPALRGQLPDLRLARGIELVGDPPDHRRLLRRPGPYHRQPRRPRGSFDVLQPHTELGRSQGLPLPEAQLGPRRTHRRNGSDAARSQLRSAPEIAIASGGRITDPYAAAAAAYDAEEAERAEQSANERAPEPESESEPSNDQPESEQK